MNNPSITISNLISDQQLDRFAELIYQMTGIRLSPRKKSLLTNRLRSRLVANDLVSFDEYYDLVYKLKQQTDHPEWNAFLESITTHETYLFRDENQWAWLNNEFIPAVEREARDGNRKRELNIWSAACSRGDEAFTIASCLAMTLKQPDKWKINILGTDIGMGTLDQAKAACFGARSMQKVPARSIRLLFEQNDDSTWSPRKQLRDWVSFRHHNLIHPLSGRQKFDLIFLKNVLIYFDPDSKKIVMDNIFKTLADGGYLVVGPAEGVTALVQNYERKMPWLYYKSLEKKVGE